MKQEESIKRRNTVWDDFIFFDPKSDRLILVCRDCGWNGEWEYFHFDGKQAWHTKGFPKTDGWELIDRLPEKTL